MFSVNYRLIFTLINKKKNSSEKTLKVTKLSGFLSVVRIIIKQKYAKNQ